MKPAIHHNRLSLKGFSAMAALLALVIGLSTGCAKKTDEFQSSQLNEYFNLEVGKWVRYRLDSLLYINFGQKDTTIYYEAKDVVDGTVTDNLGRPGWRIVRYLRDTASTSDNDWQATLTYEVIPTRETVEVLEQNLRYQKLKLPVKEGFSWDGNSYISTFSYDPTWDYTYLDYWNYTYANVDAPFEVFGGAMVDSTLTVNEQDVTDGTPSDPNLPSSRTYSMEVYGKGIGLIYKDFIHWEHQPPNGSAPSYTEGAGIKLVMIDHN